MAYLSKLISKWMPEEAPRVKVDSRPRLSGIMDTLNATLSHGKATLLPKEFYDPKLRNIIETIGVEEWFSGYQESQEFRMVGIGGLVGDVVSRMVESVEQNKNNHVAEAKEEANCSSEIGEGSKNGIKFAMSGCHDTTIAGFLSGFGAFKNEPWPPFTSHIALELFRRQERARDETSKLERAFPEVPQIEKGKFQAASWLTSIFGSASRTAFQPPSAAQTMSRKPSPALSPEEKRSLEEYFVRLRYNDRPVTVPGCKAKGDHFPGDESLCTLVSLRNAHFLSLTINTHHRKLLSVSLIGLRQEAGRTRATPTWIGQPCLKALKKLVTDRLHLVWTSICQKELENCIFGPGCKSRLLTVACRHLCSVALASTSAGSRPVIEITFCHVHRLRLRSVIETVPKLFPKLL